MESEYHGIARETIGTLLFTAHDVDVSDYMCLLSIARIDRRSDTTVMRARSVDQIVHYLGWVYRRAACRVDSAARLEIRHHERAPAARHRITRRCGDALR
jgi:hypothetical protein